MKTLSDIRRTYLDYFAKQGHAVLASAPLVPQNDPTLMFTAAGMVPFKDYFTGKAVSPNPRVATSQKCVRAGGKHNDLENVGYTARHHTFFEMLGNFSFGDYFKEDAIKFAWELVNKEYGLSKDKLLVTVYHTDDEAAALWKKIAGFSDDKVIRIATKDNFWSAGDTGPCGPCTEIFYDNGPDVFGGPPGSKDEDGDRFKEIWNLVFMQYDQVDGKQVPLPKPSIDTGMGLERVTSVLQGKLNNFDIDLFQAIIHDIQDRTHTKGEGDDLTSQRVIADHLRATSFLIADGVMPSNEGRGYVLRRIMRRAMRHAYLLGAKLPLMHELVPVLKNQMGETYPELIQNEALIKDTLYREEDKFRETLERGLKLLDEEMGKLKPGGTLPGEVAFKLYDTFGFPQDLTNDVLVRKGLTLDGAGFDAAMEKQKQMGRDSWSGSGDQKGNESLRKLLFENTQETEVLDYDQNALDGAHIELALVNNASDKVDVLKAGMQSVTLVLDKTCFYAESGGQVGDQGEIKCETGVFRVDYTNKDSGRWLHTGDVIEGYFDVTKKAIVSMTINTQRRRKIERNHSGVHLLHEALRQELGDHVAQKGSLVDDMRMRLDFSQPDPITKEQLKRVTDAVRKQIVADTNVTIVKKPIDEARAMGARALFGEKYGDVVRVVSMGTTEGSRVYSIELCGGTHVKKTGDIGAFRIASESGVSAGVRRISAFVGTEAENMAKRDKISLDEIAALLGSSVDSKLNEDEVSDALSAISDALKVPVLDISDRLNKIKQENYTLQKELAALGGSYVTIKASGDLVTRINALQQDAQKMRTEIGSLRRKAAMGGGAEQGNAVEKIGTINFLSKIYDDLPVKDLKPIADQFKQDMKSGIVVLATKSEGKASIVTSVTADLTGNPKYNAVTLVNIGSAIVGGKGGGRPDMAQAGGTAIDRLDEAVAAIRTSLAS